MHPVDEQLLATLRERRLEYPSVVGATVGVHPAFAAQRFERLQEQDLVEGVTPETVYRVTARGDRLLEDDARTAVPASDD